MSEEHTSSDGVLTLVVEVLGDNDVAIGFRGFSWHTHADTLATLAGATNDVAVREFVDAVLADELVIAILSIDGVIEDVWITDDPESEADYQRPEETLVFRYWSGCKPRH